MEDLEKRNSHVGLELTIEVEELEEKIAPGMRLANHNETLVRD